jgi:hypothetical protein
MLLFLTIILGFPITLWGGWSILLGLALIAVGVSAKIIVHNISSYVTITLERYMTMHSVELLGIILFFSISELWLILPWKGFSPVVLLLFLPQIVIPLIMGFLTHRKLMTDPDYTAKKLKRSQIKKVGVVACLIGLVISKTLSKELDEDTSTMLTAVCMVIVNSILSTQLVSIQKLYYIKKYNIDFDAELYVESGPTEEVKHVSKSTDMDAIPFTEVDRTHNVHDFFDNFYIAYNGGKCACWFFNEYAYVEKYKAIAFHYVDGEKYNGFFKYQTLFVLDVYYDKEVFMEISDRILTEQTGKDAKSFFATSDGMPDTPFHGCKIIKGEFPYDTNNASVLFDPQHHTIRYVFYVHNTGGVEDALAAIKRTLRIKDNKDKYNWIFDYSDMEPSDQTTDMKKPDFPIK